MPRVAYDNEPPPQPAMHTPDSCMAANLEEQLKRLNPHKRPCPGHVWTTKAYRNTDKFGAVSGLARICRRCKLTILAYYGID